MLLTMPFCVAQNVDIDVDSANQFRSFKTILQPTVNQTEHSEIEVLNYSDDLYSIQLLNWTANDFSLGVAYRMEDEILPYDNSSYQVSEAFYFDFVCSYTFGNLDFKCSVENLIDFNNQDFSIDPFLVDTTSLTKSIYFSHEANFLISLNITYNL